MREESPTRPGALLRVPPVEVAAARLPCGVEGDGADGVVGVDGSDASTGSGSSMADAGEVLSSSESPARWWAWLRPGLLGGVRVRGG